MKIFLTGGDPGGINYEILIKAFSSIANPENIFPVLSKTALYYWQDQLGLQIPTKILNNTTFIEDIDPLLNTAEFKIAEISQVNGEISLQCLNFATQCVLKNPQQDILLTMPIHKKAVALTGLPHFTGHTEYLAQYTNSPFVTMVLANPSFAVALVTTHLSLQDVSFHLSEEKIISTATQFYEFAIKKDPSACIQVCSLNPHNGDEGLLGKEENTIIIPAVKKLKQTIKIEGPYPADSIFKKAFTKEQAFFLAMYHDQGLIPVKMIGQHESVNITLGLPFFRISVDHGTAFDIVGQNKARLESFFTALNWIFFR